MYYTFFFIIFPTYAEEIREIRVINNDRISKDTSGGYGTGNDFGEGLIPFLLKKRLKYISDWPPLFAAYTHSILKEIYEIVDFKKINNFQQIKDEVENYDYFIIVSSIVCCETELSLIKELFKRKNTDYGDAFATYGPVGVLVRMGDKITRMQNITNNGINFIYK